MRILAIDPGSSESAYVYLDGDRILAFGKVENHRMRSVLCMENAPKEALVIEKIACYGMAVGEEVFETCRWTGRFIEAWEASTNTPRPCHLVTRMEVKMHLCHNPKAGDANIRQALIDRYGGKEKAVGNKKTPGPLYGISKDVWAALAVGLTWMDKRAAGPDPNESPTCECKVVMVRVGAVWKCLNCGKQTDVAK